MPPAEAAIAPLAGPTGYEVPVWRLVLLRLMCGFFVVSAIFKDLPALLNHEPTERGMISSLLAGLWVMAIFGIRYPLKVLPIFIFECVWKTIWLIFFGLPQWISGTGSPRLAQDMFEIGAFGGIFALLIPWSFVWRNYVRAPAERWR